MAASPWVVHKFGGSSVADAACFQRVAAILDAQPAGRLGVVLSACKGVTDTLLGLVAQAERQDLGYRAGLDALRERHAQIAGTLLTGEAANLYMSGFDRDRHDIDGILQAVRLTRSAGRHITDLIAGFGEIWSTRLFREFYESRSAAAARPIGAMGRVAPANRRRRGCRLRGYAGHHRVHRHRYARRADHAGAQWQRFFSIDLRLAARCRRDPHLDRCRWRPVG
jgi:aspartokinase